MRFPRCFPARSSEEQFHNFFRCQMIRLAVRRHEVGDEIEIGQAIDADQDHTTILPRLSLGDAADKRKHTESDQTE